ncbi:acid phosphatase, stationary phase survival protein [Blattabacterium punctulatus CPU2]|uniref:5'-nucleotidase SurE n=1 Tax=Blattabacterium punctulatus CPU2 TaxID=1457032 RepID=A0AAD1CLU1_9FLAO|nr:5'/3'-nucleotidase SurE [Blattabacterium punctulatus]AWU39431.1 5'/3'-nucleotidase SurE [Blattabacterium punctulatus]BBA17653.1 acid phosphatase, stationary phase survival protein [Blattabacterium punctulatus CPU2]
MKNKPIILVTNDDGIIAPGIRALVNVMNSLGEVYVVAPNKPQSGIGHAITMDTILYCDSVQIDNGCQKEWECSGTPVDCVKLAISNILPRKPDICVSGINHGSNSSINIMYSGTISAVIEAGIEGIPSVGFSLLDFDWNADFEPAKKYVCKIVKKILYNPIPKGGISLNVNIPKKKIKGMKICRQSESKWKESFDKRYNPKGRTYYWLIGDFINFDKKSDTDEWALKNGYVSIVPIKFDLTDYPILNILRSWNFILLFIFLDTLL